MRRLRNDLTALERLQSDSTVFRFTAQGAPPQKYLIFFKGKSLWRDRGKVRSTDTHRVEIKLGASYPRAMPEIRWITPIYHPNISEIGMVCLGGYGTHWVPSVQLDELCTMLWDMARYHNYDIRSPYNREAALWVASQTTFLFPVDSRPLRDLRAAKGRVEPHPAGDKNNVHPPAAELGNGAKTQSPADSENEKGATDRVREFINRYGAMFVSGGSPAHRPRSAQSDRAAARARGPVPNHAAPVPTTAHSQEEGIVLLESDNPADPPADPPTEPRRRNHFYRVISGRNPGG